MSAIVRIHGHEATIDGYRWRSDDKTLERLLNAHLHPLGPSGADPNPDGTAARRMADLYGGKVLRVDSPAPSPRGTIH